MISQLGIQNLSPAKISMCIVLLNMSWGGGGGGGYLSCDPEFIGSKLRIQKEELDQELQAREKVKSLYMCCHGYCMG